METNVYELLYMARCRDDRAIELLRQYFAAYIMSLYKQVSGMFPTIEYDEIAQICHLALCESVYYYREDRNASFATFAILCMKREVNHYIKKQYRNCFFNQQATLSLDSPILDGETILMDTVENHKAADGEKNTRAKLLDEMIRKQLNERELLVYEYRIKGYDYEEIAHFTCLTTKQVDNALQSIKKKTRAIIENK